MAPTSKSLSRQKVALILFQARLFREGKLEKFWADRAACKGKAKFGSGECKAMARRSSQIKKDYGWVGTADEFEREKALRHAPLANRRKEAMAEAQRNKGRSGLDKAFDALPSTTNASQEVAWVQSHPKMRRALHEILQGDEERQPPKITAADITSPSNGPCPSKTAFNMLLSWLANPKEFQKQMLSKQRDVVTKPSEGGHETNGVVSDDLSALKRIHEQFLAQQKAAS